MRLDDLIERQNWLWNRMQDIQRAADEDGRDWTTEERTNWDAADADLTAVTGDIERLQRAARLEQPVIPAPDPAEDVRGGGDDGEQRAAAYAAAFGAYMRGGMDQLTGEQRALMGQHLDSSPELRAQATTPGSAGGFLIPPGYRAVMTEALKAYGGLYNLANVITTGTGNPLQWPSNDDTANVGAILAENATIPTQDVTLGTKTLGAYVYTSKLVLVSWQLLQDSAFDLDTWLPGKLGERIGRAVAAHFISGTGTAQPLGVATNATAAVTGAAGFGITYNNLIDLEHSIDPAYRASGRARFLLNDTTLSVIRKIADTQGRPLWVPVPAPGMSSTINGVPYTVDQNMASPGANAKSILFGDFEAAYIIRQVVDMQMIRLAERFADALQVGFFSFSRLDATVDNAAAVKCLQHGAT